ncbi:MAG: hypothetical protein JKY81_01575 [Colwellia sp.]|nr:hypothetical protein [Colwellia sp.]
MSEDIEQDVIQAMLTLNSIKDKLSQLPIEASLKVYGRLREINNLSSGMMLRCDTYNEALDGRDQIELLKEAGM